MSQYKGFQKISLRDAFAIIGLHDRNESTYCLDNMIIEIKDDGLKITYISPPRSASPDQIHHVSNPFKYTFNKIEYLIVNENGKLVVYEKEQIIGNQIP